MRGPNYWSNYRQKLIVMKLDLGKFEELPTNKIPKFYDRIMRVLPSLSEHRCSEGRAGGLCERMQEGTWLGHVVEHVALELQVLAGMDCGYGRTRSAGEYGIYMVVFSYLSEEAGIYAGKAAVDLVKAITEEDSFDVKKSIDILKDIWADEIPGPSTQTILDEAAKRKIPVTRMDNDSLYMLGYGRNQQVFRATVMGTTNNLAVESVACKWFTKEWLNRAGIPVPKGVTVHEKKELEKVVRELPFPWVIKPIDGNHGRGITANIRNKEIAVKAANQAWKISDKILIEEFVEGADYRFLVINYKLIAVAKRTPASVRGDGQLTIRELIAKENGHPDRGSGHEKVLTRIRIDHQTKGLLKEAGLSLSDVLPSIAVGIVSGFTLEDIRTALISFVPSPELTPGRMNLFEFAHCRLMLDYAHNASGFDAIRKYVDKVEASSKICIIGATGDRRDEDIRNLGKYAASIFNEIIIRHDKDGRGRTNEEMTGLILEGIHSVNSNLRIEVISDEAAAIEFAVSNAPQDAFIFVCADHVKHSIDLVRKLREKLLYSMSKVS